MDEKIDFTKYTIETDKFPKDFTGFNFIVMSDLHSNSYGINLHEVNSMIKKASPDAILMAGDMINGTFKDDPTDVINYISTLAGHYPVFYALGNHEYRMKLYDDQYGDKYYTIRDYLGEKGVVFLEDETITLEKDNAHLALSGLEIDAAFYSKFHKTAMGSGLVSMHLGEADKDVYNLMLAHNPEYFNRYAEWGADLVISGHLHGGMVRIPGLGGMMSPKFKLMPEYDYGMFEYGDSMMLVSRGLGAHTIKVRINNNPELVNLKILAKSGL